MVCVATPGVNAASSATTKHTQAIKRWIGEAERIHGHDTLKTDTSNEVLLRSSQQADDI
jgi:hypothetical protein